MNDLQSRLQSALGAAYRIERELGGGGMSRVFVAEETELGRKVVIKVLPPELSAGVNRDRFRREIQLAASLQHPHIVPLLAAGHTDDLLYYTMPLIEGESLRAKLARQDSLPIPDAVKILRDVVDALNYAHRHGVVHRDIKPDNVLLSDHHAVVTDFGVAKALGEATGESSITSIGVALGTPAYMAPEQAAADPHADHRVDIYAVGTLAYEMLTGRPPFVGNTPQAVLAAQVTEAPVPVTKQRATVPPALAETVMRCLEKRPADRWQTAEELLRLLDAMATPSGGTMPVAAIRRGPAQRPWPFAVGAVVLVAAGIGLRGLLGGRSEKVPIDRNVVAVLPFRVTGADSTLHFLHKGMVDLLAAMLTGEGGPRAADPQSVMSAWKRAAAVAGEDFPREQALRLARDLGAGQLLVGGIVGTGGRLVLTASTIAVADGKTLAQANVEGQPDSLTALVDRLTAQLLATGAGEVQQSLSQLTTASLPALRSYLDGRVAYRAGRYDEAARRFEHALQLDSTFALAGLALNGSFITSQDGPRGLAVAWAAQKRLSVPDRALLKARAGPRYPLPASVSELITGWQQATEIAPEAAEAWFDYADWIFHFGQMVEMENWQQRAGAYFGRAWGLDSGFVAAPEHLLELAAYSGDTATVRSLGARYLALDSVGDLADFVQWHVALVLRDRAALAALRARFDQVSPSTLARIVGLAQIEGMGLDDAGRASTVLTRLGGSPLWSPELLPLNQGRPAAAQALIGADNVLGADWHRILSALYWDGDSTAAADAGRRLAASADGPLGRDSAARANQYGDICSVQLWRVAHNELGTADRATTVLRAATIPRDDPRATGLAHWCATAIDAQVAAARHRSDATAALTRLDSLSLSGLDAFSFDWFAGLTNLVIARLREERGDRVGALRAVRRRYFHFQVGVDFLSTYLREEGRLAALTGDRAGAIRAYQHYLALRSDPEPGVKPEVDRVKAELARLVGEQ